VTDYKIVIPARYASSRLPGKPLLEVGGKALLQHVCDSVAEAGASEIIVATDDQRIANAAKAWGSDVAMTDPKHLSGTDRVAEVARQRGWSDGTIVVNVQGDEPLMPVAAVTQLAANMAKYPDAAMATLGAPLHSPDEIANPNAVKLVRDRNGFALYFSRAPIPWNRERGGGDSERALRHIGIYAYRVSALEAITNTPPCELELIECLEQLRVLDLGLKIHADIAAELPGPGVDTPEDLKLVAELLKQLH
jgi:3-deoxy-manno-octulosonate cytidylyltransferase (CMP-KDO synthetase)